jgi:hypothetical protein
MWIDTNKGDSENPNVRCRLVGKEFRTGPDDALFASTPPLEALKLIISRAATLGIDGKKHEVMINDVSRAYFYAKCTRDLYVELPVEDLEAHPDFIGKLRLCLYGTRDAALNWQETPSEHLISQGLIRGIGHPSVFHHPARNIWTLVHGDDYCSAGSADSLDWLQTALENGTRSRRRGSATTELVGREREYWKVKFLSALSGGRLKDMSCKPTSGMLSS